MGIFLGVSNYWLNLIPLFVNILKNSRILEKDKCATSLRLFVTNL